MDIAVHCDRVSLIQGLRPCKNGASCPISTRLALRSCAQFYLQLCISTIYTFKLHSPFSRVTPTYPVSPAIGLSLRRHERAREFRWPDARPESPDDRLARTRARPARCTIDDQRRAMTRRDSRLLLRGVDPGRCKGRIVGASHRHLEGRDILGAVQHHGTDEVPEADEMPESDAEQEAGEQPDRSPRQEPPRARHAPPSGTPGRGRRSRPGPTVRTDRTIGQARAPAQPSVIRCHGPAFRLPAQATRITPEKCDGNR